MIISYSTTYAHCCTLIIFVFMICCMSACESPDHSHMHYTSDTQGTDDELIHNHQNTSIHEDNSTLDTSYTDQSNASLSIHTTSSSPSFSQSHVQSWQSWSTCNSTESLQSYQRYVKPLLAEGRDSSCSQCHLGGSALHALVYDTPCETMHCWEKSGIVNLTTPADSLLLSWIQRADGQVPEHIVQAEQEGFLEWIEHYATCGMRKICPEINQDQHACIRGDQNQSSSSYTFNLKDAMNKDDESSQDNTEDMIDDMGMETDISSNSDRGIAGHQGMIDLSSLLKRITHIPNERERLQHLARFGFSHRLPRDFYLIEGLCNIEQTRYFFWKTLSVGFRDF